jgi:hypothetical protein
MSEHQDHEHGDGVYVINGSDGESYHCRLLQIFDFEGVDYAILLRLEPEDDQGLIVMRMIEQRGDTSFEVIETDDEFDRVIQYVHELADSAGLTQ